jgi:hypothetical protein
MIREN